MHIEQESLAPCSEAMLRPLASPLRRSAPGKAWTIAIAGAPVRANALIRTVGR